MLPWSLLAIRAALYLLLPWYYSYWSIFLWRVVLVILMFVAWLFVDLSCFCCLSSTDIMLWRNHPKLLGPGALIFVAKQLWPNSARTGGSSSEASIKATLFQDRTYNTHTKVSPEITTQNISYIIRVCSGKVNLLQNHIQSSEVLRSPNYTNYSIAIVSAEVVKDI